MLELGKDYTLAYKDNLNASDTAKVIVKGAGKYYGEVQKLFTIDKAPLTVTAKDKFIVYGNEPANDGVEYSGFIGEENESVLGGELSYSYSYKKLDKVGEYTITPSGLISGNYEITFAAGTLTVKKADVSVEALAAKEKLVYSGKSQELVTAGKTNFGTLLYSLDGEKYSAEIPAATDAKTYTVYYKVEGSDNWNALETKTITLCRAGRSTIYPAKFQLVMTTSTCPCGNFGSRKKICLCSAKTMELYWKKFSAPLLDRIAVRYDCNKEDTYADMPLKNLREMIKRAWERQYGRQGKMNEDLTEEEIKKLIHLTDNAQTLLDRTTEKYDYSPRTVRNILKVARTIADMHQREEISMLTEDDVKTAIELHALTPDVMHY